MTSIQGIRKKEYAGCEIYFMDKFSDELKQELRERLVKVCYGTDQAQSTSKIYSYKATVKEFIKRYNTHDDNSENRKKGMIGELLVHVLLELEERFQTASPFFNMEERSFKKGFDIILIESNTNDLWITETKSGSKHERHRTASSAIVGLINTAKNDLNRRLNEANESLWLNAINSAKVSMSSGSHQKEAVIKLLEQCADESVSGDTTSNKFNVVLSGVLFHPLTECIDESKVNQKYEKIMEEKLFKKVFILAIQKETFETVYSFLESEANDEV